MFHLLGNHLVQSVLNCEYYCWNVQWNRYRRCADMRRNNIIRRSRYINTLYNVRRQMVQIVVGEHTVLSLNRRFRTHWTVTPWIRLNLFCCCFFFAFPLNWPLTCWFLKWSNNNNQYIEKKTIHWPINSIHLMWFHRARSTNTEPNPFRIFDAKKKIEINCCCCFYAIVRI